MGLLEKIRSFENGAKALALGAGLLFFTGCESDPLTATFGALGRLGGETASKFNEVNRGGQQVQQQTQNSAPSIQQETPRQNVPTQQNTQQNVQSDDTYIKCFYDEPNSQIFKNLESRIPIGQSVYLFFYNKFTDINNDGLCEPDEIFGIKKRFNIKKEDVHFEYAFVANSGTNKIEVILWSESGKKLAETHAAKYRSHGGYARYGLMRRCNPEKQPDNPDVMDRLHEFGPGNYVLTTTANNGQLRRAEFSIDSSSE